MELREYLFAGLGNRKWNFSITSREKGILSGVQRLKQLADELRLEVITSANEGVLLERGSCILKAVGGAEEIIRAEEMLLGVIGKPSGVATVAANLVREAGGMAKVICGAWKKVAPEVRNELRQAIATGGAGIRITDQPFIYLDKNYVRIFGGVRPAVTHAKAFDTNRVVVVQIRGEMQPIVEESIQAAQAGAGILMIDTGKTEDLQAVVEAQKKNGWGKRLKIAYAGGVSENDIKIITDIGVDIIEAGRAIIDAPLLDFSLDIF